MMMSFCNKSFHPLLSLSNSNNNGTLLDFSLPHHHHHIFTSALIGDHKSSATFESTAIVSPPNPAPVKRDPGGIGFLDEVGGTVDGLMSCTESLGFESSDERIADDQIDQDHLDYHNSHDQDNLIPRKSCYNSSFASSNSRWQRSNLERKEKKLFPPPLSSLNQDGKPAFFLRAVRTDGRLELKEVKIGRPETLRASRQDGRLRLHLIRDEQDDDSEEEQGEENIVDDDEEEVIEAIKENDHEKLVDDDGGEEEDENVSDWKFPVTRPRCYELPIGHHGHSHGHGHQHHSHGHVHNNHPHDLHVWRQHCVTTS